VKLTRALPLAFVVLVSLLTSLVAPPAAMADPGVPDHLAYGQQPTNVQSGDAIAPPITVQVLDSDGNLVPDPVNVTLALSGGNANATLGGTTTQATSGGVATFADLTVDKTGTGYVLTASLPDAPAVPPLDSDPFDVTPGDPASLEYDQQPTDSVAGEQISPPVTVDVLDANGNLVTDQTVNVTVTLSGGNSSATLGGTTTQGSDEGVATFDDLTVDKAGASYQLNATAPGVSGSVPSDPFDVTAGSATHLQFDQQPSDVVAGEVIAPSVTVEVLDGNGNPVMTPTDVTVSLSGGDPDATLGGHTTRTSSSGVATFNDLTVDRAATGYTLDASASGLTGDSSGTFEVSPGDAAKLAFTTQPANTAAGAVMPRIEVSVEDQFGNVLTDMSGGKITLAIAHNPSGGHLSGTTERGVAGGVAGFSGLSIDTPGTGYTLSASGLGLPTRLSTPFNIKGGTTVTISASRHLVGYGVHFRLVAHLAKCLDGCTLTIYRLPYGGTQSVVASGHVDKQHNLVVAPGPGLNTTYWAEFSGDSRYLKAKSGSTKVLVHVLVADSVHGKGFAGRQGAYLLFHYYKVCAQKAISCPTIRGAITPDKENHTIHFMLQARLNGRWETVSTGDNTLGPDSSAALAWVYSGQGVRGVPLRTRAWYRGDKFNGGEAYGQWRYFKVI
jgi:hypothetical protein